MRWFRRGRDREAALPEEPLTSNHASLGLNALLQRLKEDRKYNILDLGPACGSNVEFYSRFAGKIYIEDLYQTLSSFDYLSPEDGASFDSVFRYLLPYRQGTRFDVIFGWDLFNYLAPGEFHSLSRHLSRFCRPGALWFALVSTRDSIPEQPARFIIIDDQTLRYQTAAPVMRAGPRYEETQLARLMPNFRVVNSFLLRNGFKEYIFSCRGRR